jgi:hypothetical protein
MPASSPSADALRDGRPSSLALTWVELVHRPGVVERWIRFGGPADELVVDRRTRFLGFNPGAMLAFVRWAAGDYGTIVSRIDVLRAVARPAPVSTLPGVTPGAEILLHQTSWARVRQVLEAIDAIEAHGFDPAAVAPDHWRHVHHRLSAGQPFRAYSAERHAAWLMRRELFS